MLKRICKKWAIHYITKHLLHTITADDILRPSSNGGIMIRGKRLSREQQEQLQTEAEYIRSSITFKLITDDMEYLAHRTMFEKSNSFDDLLFGKAMLYVIDVLKKKVNNLAK